MEIWIAFGSWCSASGISPLSSWVAGSTSRRTFFFWTSASCQDFRNNFDRTENEIENTFVLGNIEI